MFRWECAFGLQSGELPSVRSRRSNLDHLGSERSERIRVLHAPRHEASARERRHRASTARAGSDGGVNTEGNRRSQNIYREKGAHARETEADVEHEHEEPMTQLSW